MKTLLKTSLATLALLSGVIATTLPAQQEPPPPPQGCGQPPQEMFLKMLTEKLTLTGAQQTKIKNILEDEKTAMEVLRETASSTDREAMRTQFESIRKSYRAEIRAALTAAQQKIFDEMKPERHGPPPPPPAE